MSRRSTASRSRSRPISRSTERSDWAHSRAFGSDSAPPNCQPYAMRTSWTSFCATCTDPLYSKSTGAPSAGTTQYRAKVPAVQTPITSTPVAYRMLAVP